MRVLHICSYYITSRLYKNLVENLSEKDIHNDVYIPVHSDNLINKYDEVNSENINYIYSNAFNKLDRINFKYKNKKIYNDLINKVDVDNVDIAHAHSLFVNGYVAYKLKKEKNIDYIVAVRNTDVNVFFKKMFHLRKIGVDIMKNAKQIIFISPKYKENVINQYIPKELQEEIERKSVVIPNGIDNFWFDNLNMKNKSIDEQDIKLISVGKLDKNKNMYTAMKVTKKLNELGYKARLDIVGDGEELPKISELVNGEYKDIVRLNGYMNKEELIKLYKNSDIFIMPSKYETFGLVYIEAISQGLPVIYTRNQGFDGYFKQGTVGYNVKYDDVDEIVDRVRLIIDKKWEFKELEGVLRESFIWKNIATKYDEIYKG